MTQEPHHTASLGYALGRLERALATVAHDRDPQVRARAALKGEQWRAVIEGMTSGTVAVGSRTPVAGTPAWVTLEVAHGGFATGRYLAEGPWLAHEGERLRELPVGVHGSTERERLNAWYLSDSGQEALCQALRDGRMHIEVPEEGAIPVVAWLLEHGHTSAALELVATLRPLMHRLRFYPELRKLPRPAGSVVRLRTVAQVRKALLAVRVQPRVQTMNEALSVWGPLYDRLLALWLQTVEGEAPRFRLEPSGAIARGEGGQPIIEGGWPCRTWSPVWGMQREAWLLDYRRAAQAHRHCTKHSKDRSGFARLRLALERCPQDSRALDGRDVASLRAVLAGAATRDGAPGSEQRRVLRETQQRVAACPTHVELAAVVAARLANEPQDGGLLALEPVLAPAAEGERPTVPAGTPLPPHFAAKVRRALEAPIDELVELGVITSAEVLAIVLPQITAQVAAAGIEDPDLRALYQQVYAAFRRRRSLLLLNLEHQVTFGELPWIAALGPLRQGSLDTRTQARQTLEQVTLLALSSFPQTLLPNPLVREMGALAKQAGLDLPLVEEVAADIFMGTFTTKWAKAAVQASQWLGGTLYARYYDLPTPGEAARWSTQVETRWGRDTAAGFTALCQARAKEAVVDSRRGSYVASNGAVLEQSQILTTHDLAALTAGLGLGDIVRGLAPSLAQRNFAWIVRRQQQCAPRFKARLQMVKNTAYAWRQALFFLSLCDESTQWELVTGLEAEVARQPAAWAQRFRPVVAGLRHVLAGSRFDAEGFGRGDRTARRFLGWSIGPHWLLPPD